MSVDLTSPLPPAVRESGDDQALRQVVEELFVACQHRIGRYLVQMVDDRALAEDLLQDSVHDALRSRAQFRHVWAYEGQNSALRSLTVDHANGSTRALSH